jgi:hypothetical protein
MNREPFYFAYGFIVSMLICFTAFIISYVTCEWYCSEMVDTIVENGTVIIVPNATVETRP